MQIALTHAVTPALENCQLTYINREPIDIARASQQHAEYRAALTRAGLSVQLLSENAEHPDACFVEDTAIVLDEFAIITNMGTPSRQGEQAIIAKTLSSYRELQYIPLDATVEGGDILRIGKRIFVGSSKRTNMPAVLQLSRLLEPLGYDLKIIDVEHCLHLKTACSTIDDETILINPHWLDIDKFKGFRLIHVPESEPWAANCLRVNETLFVSAQSPQTAELIQKYHPKVEIIDISEFQKAEAGLTCLSIIFNHIN
jgi:dimethylargininase